MASKKLPSVKIFEDKGIDILTYVFSIYLEKRQLGDTKEWLHLWARVAQ